MSRSYFAALGLLAWLLFCPLASAGVFSACHEGEAAMDCCLPHEGSGAGPQSPASAAVTALAPITVVAPETATAALVAESEAPLSGNGPRLHSRLSVFLI